MVGSDVASSAMPFSSMDVPKTFGMIWSTIVFRTPRDTMIFLSSALARGDVDGSVKRTMTVCISINVSATETLMVRAVYTQSHR